MRTRWLFVLPGLLVGTLAFGQASLPTIEVRAGGTESVNVACAKPQSVSPQDVQRVLSIDDPSTVPTMRRKFIGAVKEACQAGAPHILVKATGDGTLTWKRID